jgi:hypothetical protein
MAWIVMDLDHTLLDEGGVDPMTGAPLGEMPVDGAVEACLQFMAEGHRLTVYTSRFAPMPDSERQRLKEQIEQELLTYGFPPMEVWTGSTKPDADVFIGHNHITYDGDWNLAMAQAQMMMSEMGIMPPQVQPGQMSLDGEPQQGEETDGAVQQPDVVPPTEQG